MEEQIIQPGTYVDLTLDIGFKLVFGTEGNEMLMKGLLQAILPHLKIETVLYIQNQAPPPGFTSKRSIYDVKCKLQDGSQVIVEVQRSSQEFFDDRAIYYAMASVVSQIKVGKKTTYELTPVYVVSFLNFERQHNDLWDGSIVSTYTLKGIRTNEVLTNKFEMTFVELKRFNKKISDCGSFEEKCYYCLKNMFRLEEQPKELQGDYFDTLFREAMVARFSAEVKNEYIKVMNTEADYRNQLMYAEKKGVEQGREKGRAEGRDEERLRFASFMKSKDFPVEEIIAQTGLTPEAVATL